MKTFHPFYFIGSIGIIITALLHIAFALVLSIVSNHSVYFAMYPTFIAIMVLGIGLTIKKQKEAHIKQD